MQDFFTVSIGAADIAFAAGTEDIAGDYENLLLLQQLFNKFHAGKAGFLDAGENIESAFGLIQRQPHLVEAVNHNLTAAAVFGNHIVNVLTAVF